MARRLGTILVDMGYLDEETLWKVLEEQKRSGSELLGKVAVRLGLVKEDQVLKALGEQLGMKVVKLGRDDDPGRADRAGQRDDGDGVQGRADLAEQEGQERHGGDGRAAEPVDARQPADVPGGRGQGGDRRPRRT